MALQCPRDGSELLIEHHHGIEVDHCPTCNGRWLDVHELGELEATKAGEDARRGTIQYARRDSELNCPVCGDRMTAFNYRAYDLELDSCAHSHGYWLDAGEEGQVRDVIEDRVQGLKRAVNAEAAWGNFLDGMKGGGGGGGILGGLRRLLGGR